MEVHLTLGTLASYASDICAILAFLSIAIKPVREKILGSKATQEGIQCLLRATILNIYYKNLDNKTLKEYEFITASKCYQAYIANNGNTFVPKIWDEMKEWEVIK